MSRQVFFSFEYMKDVWRAAQVRNMGKVDGSSTFSDNDWEKVKYKSDDSIKKWINDEMEKRSCIVVLIGKTTSSRKWVKYEIEQAYKKGKGIVGIYVHKLKDKEGSQTEQGDNPFYSIYTDNGQRLSNYVTCFDSCYSSSQYVYDDIKEHIEDLIEDAICKARTY